MIGKNIQFLKKIEKFQLECVVMKMRKMIVLKNKNIQVLNLLSDYHTDYVNKLMKQIQLGIMSIKWISCNNFLFYLENNIKIIKHVISMQQQKIDDELLLWNKHNKKLSTWKILHNRILQINLIHKKLLNDSMDDEYCKIFLLNQIKNI